MITNTNINSNPIYLIASTTCAHCQNIRANTLCVCAAPNSNWSASKRGAGAVLGIITRTKNNHNCYPVPSIPWAKSSRKFTQVSVLSRCNAIQNATEMMNGWRWREDNADKLKRRNEWGRRRKNVIFAEIKLEWRPARQPFKYISIYYDSVHIGDEEDEESTQLAY